MTTNNITMSLEDFNHLSMTLDIKLTKSLKPISDKVYNMMADSSAKIKSVKLSKPQYFVDNDDDPFVNIPGEDLNKIVINKPTIKITSYQGKEVMAFDAPNNKAF